MNNHLSSEQISKWVIGDATPEELRHGNDCQECRSELARVQTLLSDFRSSVCRWADEAIPTPLLAKGGVAAPQARPGWSGLPWRLLRWSPAAVAVAALAVIPAYKNSLDREREAQAARTKSEDALLLERVNSQLSRTAPASLEPLMDMLSNTTEKNEGERR